MASTARKKAKGSPSTRSGGAAGTKKGRKTGRRRSKGGTRVWRSRAVLRLIEPGSVAECPECGERVKFRARHRDQQVICNVYEAGVWQRVEQYHEHCYEAADSPHGEAITTS